MGSDATTAGSTRGSRLFVAVVPPDDVLEAVAALPRPQEPGVRWTRPDTWHVTLRFLGDRVDEATASRALAGLRAAPGVEVLQADLEDAPWPLAGRRFGAVVVANYLHRPTFDRLLAALADDGALLYETFAVGNERYGRPANPAFLLAEDELLARCGGRLRVVAFEQGRVDDAGRRAVVQRIAAVGRSCPWPPPLAGVAAPGAAPAPPGRIG